MSKASEIMEILRAATKQGFSYERTGSDHWRVVAPAGVSGTKGTVTTIASTPRTDQSVRNVKAQLRGIGFKSTRPPKPKNNATKTTKPAQRPAVTNPEFRPPTRAQQQEGTAVPKLSEVARVTGGKIRSTREIMPIKDIEQNLTLASWLVWQHIIDEIKAAPVQRGSVLRGIDGYEWAGSRQGMITRIWPGLDKPDYNVNPPSMPQARRALGTYLSGSRNMAAIRNGSATRLTLWWIRADWNEVDPSEAYRRTVEPGNWWETKVTPEEAGEMMKPAPVHVTYRCPDCAYVGVTAGSLGTHKARLNGKPHPQGKYACVIKGCPCIRPDIDSLANHISKDHRGLGLQTCRTCGAVLANRTARIKHQLHSHPEAFKHAKPDEMLANGMIETEAGPETPPAPALVADTTPTFDAMVQEYPPSVIDKPVVAGDAFSFMKSLIDEVEMLRAQGAANATMREQAAAVPGLEQRLVELEAENAELRAKYEQVSAWLNAYPFLERP